MPETRNIYFISDHTGLTAEALGHSLISRFETLSFTYFTKPFINTLEKAEALVKEVNLAAKQMGTRPIMFSTISNQDIIDVLSTANALNLDPFNSYLWLLQKELKKEPSNQIGRYHGVKDVMRYQKRMDAIDFSLITDDGLGTNHFPKADHCLWLKH